MLVAVTYGGGSNPPRAIFCRFFWFFCRPDPNRPGFLPINNGRYVAGPDFYELFLVFHACYGRVEAGGAISVPVKKYDRLVA